MNAHQKKTTNIIGWAIGFIAIALIFIWIIRTIMPAPQPVTENISYPNAEISLTEIVHITPDPQINLNTPAPGERLYNMGGTTLYLKTPLPESPAEVSVYLAAEQPNTDESVLALAEKFGIQGDIYLAPNQMRGILASYFVTAGGPRIYVGSDNYFAYYSDYGKENSNTENISDEQARIIIDDFMTSHGFNFEYRIERNYRNKRSFNIISLLDGMPILYNRQLPAGLLIEIDSKNKVFSVNGILYSTDLFGKFPIRSAGEAFQFMLESQAGTLISIQSADPVNYQTWQRTYPDNQKISIYGYVTVNNPADTGNLPFLAIDEYALGGNTAGMEKIAAHTLVVANGEFQSDNGIRKFIVKDWKISGAAPIYTQNPLYTEKSQLVITDNSNGNTYILTDTPKDLPKIILEMNIDNEAVNGEVVTSGFLLSDGSFEWKTISYYPADQKNHSIVSSGNPNLYKLNFTGASIPLPTPIPTFVPLFTDETGKLWYTMQPGDTFDSIAQKFNISTQTLMEANNINDVTSVMVGGTITIPGVSPEEAANMPNLMNGNDANEANANIIIEKAELVYFISDPRFATSPSPFIRSSYLQPMWRFTGHDRNGNLVEILVQALKDEYLSPEIEVIQ